MAKVKYGPGWRGLKVHFENAPADIQEKAAEIVAESVKDGAERMTEYIDRIDTGLMHDSVSYTLPKTSYFYGRFGWGLNGKPYEKYFRYQEQGFQHVSGKKIPPMHAMYQAFIEVREEFYRKVRDLAK